MDHICFLYLALFFVFFFVCWFKSQFISASLCCLFAIGESIKQQPQRISIFALACFFGYLPSVYWRWREGGVRGGVVKTMLPLLVRVTIIAAGGDSTGNGPMGRLDLRHGPMGSFDLKTSETNREMSQARSIVSVAELLMQVIHGDLAVPVVLV
jgi:hypothetical protein